MNLVAACGAAAFPVILYQGTGGGEVKAGSGCKIGFLLLIPCVLITVIGGRLIHSGRLSLAPSRAASGDHERVIAGQTGHRWLDVPP
jgi:hypothetical protein